MEVEFSSEDLAEAAGNWRSAMAPLYERRVGPRKVAMPTTLAPWSRWDPILPASRNCRSTINLSAARPIQVRCPPGDEDIAFAPLTQLRAGSKKKTHVATPYEHLPCAPGEVQPQAALRHHAHAPVGARTSAEGRPGRLPQAISWGRYTVFPWGAKDLLDTAGVATTYGAEPFRDRLPTKDAVVVQRLNDAGAVLVAKLSLGALALNDIWFGGQTMNPWLLEEGSSGSSAGPGAATAAGLVGFAIGSETEGSIVSPSMRCGVTGLRPTYGRRSAPGP